MKPSEAFQKAYQVGRTHIVPDEYRNWSWVEVQAQDAKAALDPIAYGYYLGRLSRRGESVADEQGMLYTYES